MPIRRGSVPVMGDKRNTNLSRKRGSTHGGVSIWVGHIGGQSWIGSLSLSKAKPSERTHNGAR